MIGFLRTRASVLGFSAVAVAILLSACGNATYAASSAPSPPVPVTSPPPATPSVGGGASEVGTRSISGIGAVLVNSNGLTLYHLTTDTSAKTTCIGGCAQVWPPLLATNGNPPSSAEGTFALIKRPDGGVQVTFNGMPLYTYTGDSRPGQANGQGIAGFFAVTS
jgi:predicted lipoprotein with Yx(FWY)xxD motif